MLRSTTGLDRKTIHVDMDAFYASVEQKVKFYDFSIMNRSKSAATLITDYENFVNVVLELRKHSFDSSRPVRLLGVVLSNLNTGSEPSQLTLAFE